MLLARELTERVIGLAIEVHRLTGPGMLESVYEGCLCHELQQADIAFQRQAAIPVTYKGVQFDEGFRADILVDRQVIIEIKAVANLLPAHDAEVLTDLRMSGLRLGLLFNFHARLLKDGYGELSSEPLRAAPWFFVVSVVNACNRTARTDHTALSDMTGPRQHNRFASVPVFLRKPSVRSDLRNMSDTGH